MSDRTTVDLIAEYRAEICRLRDEIKRLQEPVVPVVRDEHGCVFQTCIDCGERARPGRTRRPKPRCRECEIKQTRVWNTRSQQRKRQRLRETAEATR